MKLVLDIGNTFVKAGIFEKKQLKDTLHSPELSIAFIQQITTQYPAITSVILSSVKEVSSATVEFLNKHFTYIEFTAATKIPIINAYETPETLGKDRLAAAIGGHYLYPGKDVLVIDAGTCITYDFITSAGEYQGGSISPGLQIRFKALHTFTGKLPLVTLIDFDELIGTNTEKSILSGVIQGAVGEIDAIINKYKEIASPLITVVCGGDTRFFANRVKNSIFAVPELVLIGLNEIVDHNEI